MRALATLLAVTFFAGCAGTNFSYDKARQVQVGMTEGELIELMGKPYSVIARSGSQMWVWSYANSLSGSSRAVSYELRDGRVVSVPEIPGSFR